MSLTMNASSRSLGPSALADEIRQSLANGLPRQEELSQFLTPSGVAHRMAALFGPPPTEVRLLDPGAGIGSLTAAAVQAMLSDPNPPRRIYVLAVEMDPELHGPLSATLEACQQEAERAGVDFRGTIDGSDFIESSTMPLLNDGFGATSFNRVIINPPYGKIRSSSHERRMLSAAGIETSNVYSAFVALSVRLLSDDGQLVAITPRSFANGPYFRRFRQFLLARTRIDDLHLIHKRDEAFSDDAVLQETIIMKLSSGTHRPSNDVGIHVEERGNVTSRVADVTEVIRPNDSDHIIHVPTDEEAVRVMRQLSTLAGSLASLGISASTGKVVQFRAEKLLTHDVNEDTVPLVHPTHIRTGRLDWPGKTSKPTGMRPGTDTAALAHPPGHYVSVKRFSAKEERRRIVAGLCRPDDVDDRSIAFENHTNVYHDHGAGLDPDLATGLWLWLNSTVVDEYFRIFSGHTQVNVADLRTLPYPDMEQLSSLGRDHRDVYVLPTQSEIDQIVRPLTKGGLAALLWVAE